MSDAPLLSLDEALQRLLAATRPLAGPAECIDTFDALGRVLAADVVSAIDVPPHDNSAMDGYALRCADVGAPGRVLPVTQRIAAGQAGAALAEGSAARLFTGACVPDGADAVVMQEQCEPVRIEGGDGNKGGAGRDGVRIGVLPVPGQWIRRRGDDVRAGTVVLPRGTRLTPQALGLAASVGAATLQLARRPRVALFSTGDELVMPGTVAPQQMAPAAIYNSNRYTLRALLRQAGCEVDDFGIVPDRLDATRDALRRAAARCDLILTSGGVSVGEEDHLRPAVEAEGRLDLWRVAMKPGKPLAFGQVRREVRGEVRSDAGDDGPRDGSAPTALFIGLPGNPVSSFVTFLLAVRPVLLALQGASRCTPTAMTLRADFDWPHPDTRREFLRARRNSAGGLDLFANQSSGVLSSAVWADGLVDNAGGQAVARGDAVRFLPFAEWT